MVYLLQKHIKKHHFLTFIPIPECFCRESVVVVIASEREAIYVASLGSKDCPVAVLLATTKI